MIVSSRIPRIPMARRSGHRCLLRVSEYATRTGVRDRCGDIDARAWHRCNNRGRIDFVDAVVFKALALPRRGFARLHSSSAQTRARPERRRIPRSKITSRRLADRSPE